MCSQLSARFHTNYKNYYEGITLPRVMSIHCLYFAKLIPVLRIGDIAQLVERCIDDPEIAGSSQLYSTCFLPTVFACSHTSLQVISTSRILEA